MNPLRPSSGEPERTGSGGDREGGLEEVAG